MEEPDDPGDGQQQQETSGALPKWDSIQSTDKNTVINPILRTYQEVTRAALEEHMKLVSSLLYP